MKVGILARVFGSTIIAQATLSAASFAVAYLVLRNLGSESYGYYVLIGACLTLLTTAQGAFFHPPIVSALANEDRKDRQSFVSGARHLFRGITMGWAFISFALALILLGTSYITSERAILIAVAILASLAVLWRELDRSILLGYHRVSDLLRGDLVFAFLLVGLSVLAVMLPAFAVAAAVASICVAAFISGRYMTHLIRRFEPWSETPAPDIYQRLKNLGYWSLYGALVHWSFTQGYTYLVALILDVQAVGVIAATRLLLMPVNMLTTGVVNALYPLVTRWNSEAAPSSLLRRVAKVVALLLLLSGTYVGCVWLFKDWLFAHVIHQDVADGSKLLVLWSLIFLILLSRDLLSTIVLVRSGFKAIGHLTLLSAVLALMVSWLAMPHFGAEGALMGMLVGESVNLIGSLMLLGLSLKRTT